MPLMMVLRSTHGLFEPRDEEGVVAALAQLDLQVQQLRHLAVGHDTGHVTAGGAGHKDTSQQEGVVRAARRSSPGERLR